MSSASQLLTVKQVAERLQIHEKTVALWLRDRRLAGIRLGDGPRSEWRVREEDLLDFLERRRVPSDS